MKVTIEVSPNWVGLVRSPVYYIVAAFTGVSVTFSPLFLYMAGRGQLRNYDWLVVPFCFGITFFVPLFYVRLGSMVIRALRKIQN